MSFQKNLMGTIVAAGLSMAYSRSAQAQVTRQEEARAHPRLVAAIREMHHALDELKAAPDDFGGHKGQAMQSTRQAIHDLKVALWYRVKMDDAAIDATEP